MRTTACVAVLFLLVLPSTLFAAGFSHDENFIVYAPDQVLSDQVIAKAEEFRKAEAKDLLGIELDAGKGRTIITVEVSATEDSGFTWPIDHPDRKFHEMWLTTSRQRAAGSTLRHEIRHVVLNTRFPDRLPLWIEEGLASRSDDEQRQRLSRETAARFSRSRLARHPLRRPVAQDPFDRPGDVYRGNVAGQLSANPRRHSQAAAVRRVGQKERLGPSAGRVLRHRQPARVAIEVARLGCARRRLSPAGPRGRDVPACSPVTAAATVRSCQ